MLHLAVLIIAPAYDVTVEPGRERPPVSLRRAGSGGSCSKSPPDPAAGSDCQGSAAEGGCGAKESATWQHIHGTGA